MKLTDLSFEALLKLRRNTFVFVMISSMVSLFMLLIVAFLLNDVQYILLLVLGLAAITSILPGFIKFMQINQELRQRVRQAVKTNAIH